MPQTKRIIVKLKPISGVSAITIEQLVEEIRGSLPQGVLVRGPGRSGRVVFSVDPGADVAGLAADLCERDDIAYAEPDVIDRES